MLHQLSITFWLTSVVLADQIPLVSPDSASPRDALKVAVIGGGLAGASVTSRLASYTSINALNITVFERENRVGGRVETFESDAEWGGWPLELGASRISPYDTCLHEFVGMASGDLEELAMEPDQTGLTARCDIDTADWKVFLRLVLRYGRSAFRVRNLVRSTAAGWRNFLQPSDSTGTLQEAFDKSGLGQEHLYPASYFFQRTLNGQANAIEHDIIQPCTQARAHKNHGESNAITALLSAGLAGAVYPIYYGSIRLIESAFEYARVEGHLRAQVTKIGPGKNGQLKVFWTSLADDKTQEADFDIVVLASPYHSAAIDFEHSIPGLNLAQVPRVDYEERHVTYFTSPLDLTDDVKRFLDVTIKPEYLITGSLPQDNVTSVARSSVCYSSCRPGDPYCGEYSCEYLYKVMARHPSKDIDLSEMLNHNSRGRKDYRGRIPPGGVTWSKKKAWKEGLPGLEVQIPTTVELAPGLYYTAGLEHVVSSMEMSCRMGRYVADQILQKL